MSAPKLSTYVQSRDNNFNLLRILAAFAVLVSHSFALVAGSGAAEPLRDSLGTSLGNLAVDAFFVTSGFLVSGSLLTRNSAIEFLWARILRIYPALWVMVGLTVFGLGAFFTSLPLFTYFSERETYLYLVKNLTLLMNVAYTLPGVFETVPSKGVINGSLWSMPLEIRMYLILFSVWILLRVTTTHRLFLLKVAIVILAIAGAFIYLPGGAFPTRGQTQFYRLLFMFFTGASFYVLKERIFLSWAIFLPCAIALIAFIAHKQAFFLIYNLSLAYMLLFLAYIPGGWLRSYNRLGDYSYGLYIYGFPVQQSVASFMPGGSVFQMLAISSLVSLVLAAMSWHLLEQRALKLKTRSVSHSRRFITSFSQSFQRVIRKTPG